MPSLHGAGGGVEGGGGGARFCGERWERPALRWRPGEGERGVVAGGVWNDTRPAFRLPPLGAAMPAKAGSGSMVVGKYGHVPGWSGSWQFWQRSTVSKTMEIRSKNVYIIGTKSVGGQTLVPSRWAFARMLRKRAHTTCVPKSGRECLIILANSTLPAASLGKQTDSASKSVNIMFAFTVDFRRLLSPVSSAVRCAMALPTSHG